MRAVWMIGPALQARGGIASVLVSYREAGLFERCGIRYGCSYDGAGVLRQGRTFLGLFARLALAMARNEVALLHLHSASRGSFWRKSFLAALARCFKVPYLFHIHSGEFLDHYLNRWPRWQAAWARLTLQRAARVLVLTAGWQQAFSRVIPDAKWFVALNPVAVPSEGLPVCGPRDAILFLGRLSELKGAFDLLRAMQVVLRHHGSAKLVMAGPGDRPAIEALMRELQLPPDSVSFPGWIEGEEKAVALREAGTFVLPSHAEGLPISVLEAMANGLVVVATRVGGIPELIDDEQTGLLVPPEDPKALAQALLRVIAEPQLASDMCEAAFRRAKQHGLENVASELELLYRSILVDQD